MDFHFSSSLLSPSIPSSPSWLSPPPPTPVNTLLHPFFSLALPCRRQREAILEGQGGRREEGREARGKWSVGSGSSLSLCHSYDSRVIRLINEIIDHLMGLIINCFSTVSCPISSSSSSLLMLLYTSFFYPCFIPPKRLTTLTIWYFLCLKGEKKDL